MISVCMRAFKYNMVGFNRSSRLWLSREPQLSDLDLMRLLNRLGAEGWRVVASGQFAGDDVTEILLEKETDEPV